ncbi:hypothetical protein RB195_022582 [Necator americanus]|uniref:Uncharacterized protein n=1 Tax=Necator americanus TaxID=51031 RepID=A0ABR1EFV1_NECAM
MDPEKQADVLGKWYCPAKQTLDNGNRLVEVCKETNLVTASKFKMNHRHYQLEWPGSERRLRSELGAKETFASSAEP